VFVLFLYGRRLEAGRSPCNKAQQLSSFESEQEHGKRRCTAPVYLKDYDTDGMVSYKVGFCFNSIVFFSVEEEEEEEELG
jgi:hypothetical protein